MQKISDSFDTTPPSHTTGASHATHHGDVSHGGIANYGNQNFSGRARIVNNFWRPLVGTGPSSDDLKKIIETQTEWSTLLGQLSVVDQDQYRSEISQLDRNGPNFYWVTRNMDFEKWESDDSVQVLWLSGPPNRGMTEVSSHAINLAKESAPEANGPVLHFLCSAGARFGGSRSMTTLFTHTVLHQIVCYSSAEKSKSITTIFLNTLLEGHFRRRDAPRFDKNDSVDTTMQKILDASDDDNFRALTAAFWEADIQELSVIIDGIEGGRFVQNVYLLIRHMMEATSATRKFKALLTCLPVSDLRDMLGGMLYIEYDKERNECLRFLRHDAFYALKGSQEAGKVEEFYQLMFTRLQLTSRNRRPVDIQDGMKILRFALFGFRAITMDELRHVLAIPNVSDPPSIPSYEEFTTNEITNVEEIIKRITHCGGGFVEINADRTVQLMHQTVREFFLRLMVNPDEKPMGFPRSSQEAHKMMATTCIQYLMLCFMNPLIQSRFSGNKTWDSNDFQDYVEYLGGWPLFNYTLRYLKDHKELCDQNEQISQLISLLVNALMDNQASYFLGDWLESRLRKIDPVRQQPRARGSSNFGQEFLLKTTGTIQLGNPAPVYQRPSNVEDFKFRTINAAATADGLSGVAEALLLSCTEVDGHVNGKTPLIISARMGLEATIRLVARGIRSTADMNARDDSGNTALHHAVKGRHEATVQLLIELDVDRNITNNKGWTALRLAIEML
ncbi:hypothetical protein K440DRAFT_644732 [Wilcoxina mikolae CBS 423.85]|nr:hypothetical protein K440DRAFT_644732 [Wilcoxina mikolae CBS 423.85]